MFTHGFEKTANYDETAEYEKANKVARIMIPWAQPTDDAPLKEGSRVAYHSSDRGWKEGPWAHHTKGCSHDEAQGKPRKKLEQKLKKAGVDPMQISKIVDKKYPWHHMGADKKWSDHAVGIGDLGRVSRVEKSLARHRYAIVWDKHPDCEWALYDHKDVKIPPKGM